MTSSVNSDRGLLRTRENGADKSRWPGRIDVTKMSRTGSRYGRVAGCTKPQMTHRLEGLILAGKRPTRVVRPVFRRHEGGFRIGVVVGHYWSQKRPEHAQFLQPAFQPGGTYVFPVVGVQNQRLLTALAEPLE